jgi:hypothetical protein
LNCKWGFTRRQWYCNKTQHTTHISHKITTTLKQNTAHKSTPIIKVTLHTTNAMGKKGRMKREKSKVIPVTGLGGL